MSELDLTHFGLSCVHPGTWVALHPRSRNGSDVDFYKVTFSSSSHDDVVKYIEHNPAAHQYNWLNQLGSCKPTRGRSVKTVR